MRRLIGAAVGCTALALVVSVAAAPVAQAENKPSALVYKNSDDFSKDARYAVFYQQKLGWDVSCGDPATVQCAHVLAPKDWYHPEKGTIKVLISRQLLDGKPVANPRLLFTNPGGPGASGIDFSSWTSRIFDLAASHTPIGIEPRGTGAPLCNFPPLPGSGIEDGDSRGTTIAEARVMAQSFRTGLEKCYGNDDSWDYVNSDQTVRDFNLVRAVLGYQTADYFGASYGTWLGSYLEKMFPESFDRVILDANADFSASLDDVWLNLTRGYQLGIDRVYLSWLARHNDQFKLGDKPVVVWQTLERMRLEVKQGKAGKINLRLFDFGLLTGASPNSMEMGAEYMTQFRAALQGDAQARQQLEQASAEIEKADIYTMPAYHAINCNDVKPLDQDQWYQRINNVLNYLPVFANTEVWASRCPVPVKPYPGLSDDVRAKPMHALVAQNDIDPNTPYFGAYRAFRNTKGDSRFLRVINGVGHGAFVQACARSIMRSYLVDGKYPSSNVSCTGDPLPKENKTYYYEPKTDEPMPMRSQYMMRDFSVPAAAPASPAIQETTDREALRLMSEAIEPNQTLKKMKKILK